jgi:hypothetical protein
MLRLDSGVNMNINKIVPTVLIGSFLLFSSLSQAAVITFDTLVSGATSFEFDADGDSTNDVKFSTTDPGGFNKAGPGSNMSFINEPGLEGTTSLSPDLRVDFLNGATTNITFGFAEIVLGDLKFSIFDNTDSLLAYSTVPSVFTKPDGTNPSDFPEAKMNLDFGGVASYALFDFEVLCENTDLLGENCGLARYIIDNFSGTFGSTEEISPIPVPAAFWLFGTALIGIAGFSRRRKLG